jgi:hypothetical protein
MGNAIRELKVEIGNSDIDLPEQDVRVKLPHLSSWPDPPRPKMLSAGRSTTIFGTVSSLRVRSFKTLLAGRSTTET